jgi:group I intron endonuclease
MNQCGVYVIRCEATGSRYVGSSDNIVKRIREHFYRLERGVHRNRRLQNAYNKYGKDGFRSEVLLYCDPVNLEVYGNKIIQEFQPEFNIVHTGHTKGAMNSIFRTVRKNFIRQDRFIKELEKMQKRTHRF